MPKLNTLKLILKDPKFIRVIILEQIRKHGLLDHLSDEEYIKIVYKNVFCKNIDLDNPITFNEKLQWLKLYDHKEIYIKLVDKYEVKNIVADKISKDIIIPTFGVWNSFSEIDKESLPDSFVLKCTHDSGSVIICKNKDNFDWHIAEKVLSNGLKRNLFYWGREWPYKYVTPRIIAEEYLTESDNDDIIDYKILCFNGVPKIILVCQNRNSSSGLTEDFYDDNWNHLDIARREHPNGKPVSKPEFLDKMLEYSSILSKGNPFARIDFYYINHCIYFGEYTLYPAAGFSEFVPQMWDKILGDWIDLNLISIDKR